jgi:hypothetical protein
MPYRALLVVLFICCAHPPAPKSAAEQVCDLAPVWRQHNWMQWGGSCAHASTISELRWNQEFEAADAWRRNHGGTENLGHHLQSLRAAGLQYAVTADGDEQLLEYAITNRRMVIVYWPTKHVTNLMGRVTSNGVQYAVILDNNGPSKYRYYEWNRWLAGWRFCSGVAIVITTGNVPPPIPRPVMN